MSERENRYIRESILTARPFDLQIGTIQISGTARGHVSVTNSKQEAIEIADLVTSCVCVDFDVETPVRIEPSETLELPILILMERDPDFTGKLAVEVWGQTKDALAFYFIVHADVKSEVADLSTSM